MIIPDENKKIIIGDKELILTPNDYLMDVSVNNRNVIILKKEAIDKLELFLDLEILPYEPTNTTVLQKAVVYRNALVTSIVEHAFVKGIIKNSENEAERKEIVVEGIGEANPLTLTENFMGYVGTMARKRAISNAVIRYFIKYLMINDPNNPMLTEFNVYSQDEWNNSKNSSPVEQKSKPKQVPNNKATIDPNINPKDYILNTGKYKGQSIGEIYKKDKEYLNWVVENTNTSPHFAQIILYIKKFFETNT